MTAIAIAITAFVVALVLAFLVHRVSDVEPSVFDTAITPDDPTGPAEQLASMVAARRVIVNATAPRSLYLRTRPVLVELVEARLRDHHGIGLDEPRAGEIVGEPLWSIVRPDARSPDHDDAALSLAEVSAALDRLEAL